MTEIYAEDAPYWGTAVPAEATLAEIMGMLLSAGVEGFQPQRGVVEGRPAWALRFPWRGRTIRIVVKALTLRKRDAAKTVTRKGQRRKVDADTLAEWQALRHLRHMLKPLLEMVIFQPAMGDALFGFAELPEAAGGDGYVPTVADVIDVMPEISNEYLLSAPTDGEFRVIEDLSRKGNSDGT